MNDDRTRYVIQSLTGRGWMGANHQWVAARRDALCFDYMTTAIGHAVMDCMLDPKTFAVDAVKEETR